MTVPAGALLALAAACSGSSGAVDSAAIASSLASVPSVAQAPRGEVREGLVVDRVVDGDTVKVTLDGAQVSVRLIGINTPETVKPGSPVECFGPEASQFAKDLLDGQRIVLEFDDSQGYFDRYDRVLAYVWRVLPDGSLRLFNEEAVAGGFAEERQYTDGPYAWKDAFVSAQSRAIEDDRGLWAACAS